MWISGLKGLMNFGNHGAQLFRGGAYRRHHCIKTLFLLYFKFVMSETKESFVLTTNALLVGTLISTGDISLR